MVAISIVMASNLVSVNGETRATIYSTISPSVFSVTWTNMSPVSDPGGKFIPAMVYDKIEGVSILFGGMTPEGNSGGSDTWAYSLSMNEWTNLNPSTRPVDVVGPVMAYDSTHRKTILFGCNDNDPDSPNDETWSYDSLTNEWTNMNPLNGPGARSRLAMVYDSESDKVILFGGNIWDTDLGDLVFYCETWAYDSGTNTWTNMTPIDSPEPRIYHAMVYDAQSDKVILFGGAYQDSLDQDHFFNDTWTYDYNTNTWMNVTTSVSPPRSAAMMAVYDPTNDLTVIFGGTSDFDTIIPSDQMWAYDDEANEWATVSEGVPPAARFGGVMSYDVKEGKAILFGGVDESLTMRNDTWSWESVGVIPEFSSRTVLIIVAAAIIALVLGLVRSRKRP